MIDSKTENKLFEHVKNSMTTDLRAAQRDVMRQVNKPSFMNKRSKGTFRVLTDAELAERRGDY